MAPLLGSIAALLLCGKARVLAQNSTWNLMPNNQSWNDNSNWSDGSPNSTSSVAIFGPSTQTNIFLFSDVQLDSAVFNPNASAYTINVNGNDLSFYGAGVTNNSPTLQNFVVPAIFGSGGSGIDFFNTSSAGSKTVYTIGGLTGGEGSAGKVHFWDSSTAGAATLIATGGQDGGAGGTIYFEANSGGGTSAVQVWGNGVLDISFHNPGSVTIGSLAGSGNVFLGGNNLTVGSNNQSTIFSGVIAQDGGEGGGTGGSLTKIGFGTLTLTGRNLYTGPTVVLGGTLLVNGSIESLVNVVNPGGTLGGTGIIFGSIYNSGNVQAGDAPGILSVKGSYSQSSAGTMTAAVGGTGINQFDLLYVSGQAVINGDLRLVQIGSTPRLKVGQKLDLLIAPGGVVGRFARVYNPFDTGTIVQYNVDYQWTTISLEAQQGSFKKFAQLWGLTPNQSAVAGGLDSAAGDPRAGALFGYLDYRPLWKLPRDFDRISPEVLTSIFTLGTSFNQQQSLNLQRRTDDIRYGSSGFSAAGLSINGNVPSYSGSFGINTGVAGPNGNTFSMGDDGKESKEVKEVAPAENRWGAFLSGTGEWVNVDGTENARGYDLTSGGFTLGVDYKVTPNFALGLMGGYVGTTSDFADHGRVWVNGGKIGLYSTAFVGGWYTDAAVTGGYSSYDTRRPGLQGTARGDTDGGDLNVLIGTGYDFKAGGLTFGPTATFNYTYTGIGGFTEHDSLAPLDIHGGSGESLRTAFGLKASYDWKVGGVVIKPELRVAWQHEYGDAAYSLASSFASGAGDAFTVSGPKLGRDSALLGAGFAVQLSERCVTYIYYDGEVGRTNYESSSVTGGFRVAF